jgi:hypothetical protein
MGVHRRKLWTTAAVVGCLVGTVAFTWRASAQGASQSPRLPAQAISQAPPPVRPTSGDRGSTYHELERETTKVTMQFADAVAVAERTLEGQLSARLTDKAGNELATVKVRQIDAANDVVEFTVAGKAARRIGRRQGLRPTLDWSNQQAYSLWKDRGGADAPAFEWQDTMLRPAGSGKRTAEPEAVVAETEWRGGLSASVTKKIGTHLTNVTNQKVTGVVYISSFKRDGLEVGSSQWWPAERAFAWSFPGLTDGYVDDSRLKLVGGWALTPDMAWMNLQNLAFYRFHTLSKFRSAAAERPQGWLARLEQFMSPRLFANEAGCDYLHWLDGSLFRPCCDDHDRCYQKQSPACSMNSWWMVWSSWSCDMCNMMAVVCFATGGHIYQRYP